MKKDNPLTFEMQRPYRVILKPMIVAFYLFCITKSLKLLFLGDGNVDKTKDVFLITGIMTIVVFGRVLNKNMSKTMYGVRGYISYKELLNYLENEDFQKRKIAEANISDSEKWLNANGTFVPKNFIANYDLVEGPRNIFIHLGLINGKEISIYCGSYSYYKSSCDEIIKTISMIIGRESYVERVEHPKLDKEVKRVLKEKLDSGMEIDYFIENWDLDFQFENIQQLENKH